MAVGGDGLGLRQDGGRRRAQAEVGGDLGDVGLDRIVAEVFVEAGFGQMVVQPVEDGLGLVGFIFVPDGPLDGGLHLRLAQPDAGLAGTGGVGLVFLAEPTPVAFQPGLQRQGLAIGARHALVGPRQGVGGLVVVRRQRALGKRPGHAQVDGRQFGEAQFVSGGFGVEAHEQNKNLELGRCQVWRSCHRRVGPLATQSGGLQAMVLGAELRQELAFAVTPGTVADRQLPPLAYLDR